DVVGNEFLLGLIGRQVVINRVAIKDRVEVVDAHVAVPTVVGIRTLSLMPMSRVGAAAFPASHRSVPSHEASGQQTRFASDLLQFAQSGQDLSAGRANWGVLRQGLLIAAARKVAPGPAPRMNPVAGLFEGVPGFFTRRRRGNDGNIETL